MVVKDKVKCLNWIRPDHNYSALCGHIFPKRPGYVFQSATWERANFRAVELTTVCYSQIGGNRSGLPSVRCRICSGVE